MPLEIPADNSAEEVVTLPETPTLPDLSAETAEPNMEDTVRKLFRKLGSPGEEGRQLVHRASDGRWTKKPGTEVSETAKPNLGETPKPKEEVAAAPTTDPAADEPDAGDLVANAGETPVVEPAKEPAKPTELDKPPSSWSKEGQAEYAAATPRMREFIHKREQDFHKGLESYKALANVGKILHAEIAPYEAMIRQYKLSPQTLIRGLMQTAQELHSGSYEQRVQVLRNMAKEYKVNLNSVIPTDEELAQEASRPQSDPEVPRLREELQRTQAQIQALNDSQEAQIKAEIDAFKDAPGHEFYDEVKIEMGALMESGRAKTLQEAYDNAIYANPQVRAKLNAKQQEDQRAQAALKAAAAKKAASANVKTKGTLPNTPTMKGNDMADTVRNVLRTIRTRAGA